MGLTFEWDERKDAVNSTKHGVRFEEASTVFGDRLSLTIPDPAHSGKDEKRYVTMGLSLNGRLIIVVHSDRNDAIRIISARPATKRERSVYEEER
jgi:uncharacterized DUF497 family protein